MCVSLSPRGEIVRKYEVGEANRYAYIQRAHVMPPADRNEQNLSRLYTNVDYRRMTELRELPEVGPFTVNIGESAQAVINILPLRRWDQAIVLPACHLR